MDEELPGFKVNYNGGREDEELGHGSEPRFEGADDAAENGSVARGEADFKPVIAENVSMGGLDGKAPETASAGVAGGPERGMNDGSGQITEAEARAMLIEDNARAKEELKKAGSRGKKTLVVVLVLAVALVAAGIGVSVILGGMGKNGAENDDKHEGNEAGNSVVAEKPEENGGNEGGEVVELSLDDELVQGVYGNFDEFWGIKGFGRNTFFKLINGSAAEKEAAMVGQAVLWLYHDSEGQGNSCDSEPLGMANCYRGEDVRRLLAEKFGVSEVSNEVDLIYGLCGSSYYDAQRDEYVFGVGCGGSGPDSFVTWLYKAETQGEYLYIYEAAVVYGPNYNPETDEYGDLAYWCTDSGGWYGENTSEVGKIDIPAMTYLSGSSSYVPDGYTEVEFREYLDKLDQFKWTFVRNAEGNYVFEGLARVE